ncbi:MAG: TIGR00730 family Rossman fold protein [Rhizomicrobium sp.]
MAHRNTGGDELSALSAAGPAPFPHAAHRGSGRRICVFCGSSPGALPAYAEAARGLGRAIGEAGHTLVFGGGAVGLMGEVARAARSAGAPIIGILPAFLRGIEPPLKSAEELIITPDLQQRKARMLALAEAFVILPGGLGTFDEYFEVITTTQLRVHAKPIIVVDVENYFAPLRALLDRAVEQGFARADIASYHAFVGTPLEAIEKVSSLLAACAA